MRNAAGQDFLWSAFTLFFLLYGQLFCAIEQSRIRLNGGSYRWSGFGCEKIKFRRHKRPCAYYANSNATFHLILDVGDLVFKLNPGPDNRITTIVSSNRMVKNGHLWSRHSLPKGANLHNLRSLDRISVAPKFSFSREFTSCLMNARSVCNKTLVVKDFVVDYKVFFFFPNVY